MSTPDGINVEAILDHLYASEINVEISWSWGGGIDVKLDLGKELRRSAPPTDDERRIPFNQTARDVLHP